MNAPAVTPLIDIRDLKDDFRVGDGTVQAVKGVSFAHQKYRVYYV